MDQVVQLIGAALILIAFAASQFGTLDPYSRSYLLLNVVGSGLLAVLAWEEKLWGFLILELVWGGVSTWGLFRPRGDRPLPEDG